MDSDPLFKALVGLGTGVLVTLFCYAANWIRTHYGKQIEANKARITKATDLAIVVGGLAVAAALALYHLLS
jgi:hypothetical protein